MIAYACLAVGILAAGPARSTTVIRLSRPRVALMFLAALAVPAALIAAGANHADVYASAIWTAAIVVLVFAQFAALLEERGAAEGRLQTRERELQTLVDNAPALLWNTDEQVRPLSVQGAALKTLDWEDDALARLAECLSHDDGANFADAHRRALAGIPVDLEESIGSRVFRCHIESITNARGEAVGTIGVGLDVTERALLEEQLLQAQKMEAVGQLAGTIAHDFNNLLTGMSGYAELALAKLAGHPASSDIAEIVRASERGASLTSRLAIFSRKRVAEPRVVDANGVVSGLEAFLTRVLGEGTTVRYDVDPEPAPVRIDPRELEQAILNLAINGRDAMNGAGELSISTRRAGSDFILEVTDSGVGMDESTRGRIFDAFFTTKEPGKGTGLGLASVRAIVSGAHGRVEAASEPGVGTTFTVALPIDQSAGDLAATADGDAAAVVGGKESILLLDDNEQVRRVTETMLERLGYHVVAVGTAREALDVASVEPFGLFVTDVVLPDGDGRGVAAEIVDRKPGVPVLFISGFTPEDGDTERGPLLTSRHAFLPKPYSLRELAAAARDLLD